MDIKDFKENKNISNTNVYFYKDVYDNEVTVINGMFFYITPDPNDKTLTRECVDRLKDIIVNEYIPNKFMAMYKESAEFIYNNIYNEKSFSYVDKYLKAFKNDIFINYFNDFIKKYPEAKIRIELRFSTRATTKESMVRILDEENNKIHPSIKDNLIIISIKAEDCDEAGVLNYNIMKQMSSIY